MTRWMCHRCGGLLRVTTPQHKEGSHHYHIFCWWKLGEERKRNENAAKPPPYPV